ncbi:conserved Plasmodium protein, unknown function [Plasmodium knowlesi strain H]|uniref:Leucine-rich repeat protein n=3 Tax=Plasmodium knowlesi TaxID=5850 RepID=A0A5K1US76_PLAKH|nr:conserved Plasmodium protein, unknown function [Plasmodium knowlesi strain H]OTN65553.1 Uncharacterized protein PKNOH_S110099800 [Plasmodium knowlesi]CAA9989617.1 conserved Plasmodium protein, unknown function [Plasmodium knowlesi strain H]SBO22698.1 conserved Plasmodium protein, unknown function [Plasmodium knowlesi strain H]SBO23243.1 conserved Plasmodium protein, unknown function [Plasmodium knowlesi strain H]VVS79091.1 conserved Plasmodium protein, unknown function [Plasmodium knowlesi |eukprot:XP_002260342.1 hypothetical protein, conserved in Plasmodium species [Plasmodium knowlesi strain H]
MDNPLKVTKDRLTNLNEAFISTIECGETSHNSDEEFFSNQDGNTKFDENSKKYCKIGSEYMHKFENLEKKEHENIDLKFVAPRYDNMTLVDPSYIRERDFGGDKDYINVSFVNDFIKVSKDEIRGGQKDFHGGSYNFTYKDGDKKKNYEYINATNEYYITKNVEEKMKNTGMTAENFFADSKMLLYEDGMNKWSDKSKYLYFVDKEEQNNGYKKKKKFKDIRLNDSLIVDNYEKVVYKQDPSSDKVKIENLILDVLNNDFDYDYDCDLESDGNSTPKEEIEGEEKGTTQDGKENIRKKKKPLNIAPKIKSKYSRSYILDYLHYDNFFHDEEINVSEKSTSDSSDRGVNEKGKYSSETYTIGNKKEFDIKSNIHNLLTKVKTELNVRDFSKFIPEQFDMDVFLSNESESEEYESDSDESMDCVLKKRKIQWNDKKMKEEMELLRKYDYVESLYSPGYCSRIMQNLRDRYNKKRINIYDLKKNQLQEKIKKDFMDKEQTKKAQENLQKFRLENLHAPEENPSADEEADLESVHGISEKDKPTDQGVPEVEHKSNDVDEEETDSSVTFEHIDTRSINNLKRKYKAMKKSERSSRQQLRRLKFYICRRVNKKKYLLKNMKLDKESKKKEKVRKAMKFSTQGGYNLLAKIQEDANREDVEEEEEDKDFEEDDIFDVNEINTSEMNSSEYTYSSLTISSYEYLNVRGVHYNDDSYENIFYHNDPRVNVTYLYDNVQFFLIHEDTDEQEKRTSKGILFMEILVYDLKFYQQGTHIEEEALLYTLEINENTTAKLEKKENDTSEILLKTMNKESGTIRCSLAGSNQQMNTIFNKIYKRILLVQYVKYLNSISSGLIENSVNYFLLECKTLNLKNVPYNKSADQIILSSSKNITDICTINLSNRTMTIEDLSEFLSISKFKKCTSFNLTKNPLFKDLAFERIKNDMDYVIKCFKSLQVKELILDFTDLSYQSAEYFIGNILLSTNISFLSLVSCELKSNNINNIVNIAKLSINGGRKFTSAINSVNVEFNKLTYYDVVSLLNILFELNKDFKILYICGNFIQSDIFDISFEFKRRKPFIEMNKFVKPMPDIFHADTIDQVKDFCPCNLQGIAELIEEGEVTQISFELYFSYLLIVKPKERLYSITNISIVRRGTIITMVIEALFNNRDVEIKLNLFKENIILLFRNIVRRSFIGKEYYQEQINNHREVNENVLKYFILRSENEINFYHYNVTREEIHFVLDLCKKGVVKNMNLGHCYLRNEDILYFNTVKKDPYDIKIYKLSLSNNLIDSDVDMEELITFLSNFTIFFKINLSGLKIGTHLSMYEFFFHLLNNTKCKIINLDNCDLGNAFLLNVNRNITKLNKNSYLTILSMQHNSFSDKKGIIGFLNNIISTCKSIEKIKVYSNYISDEDVKLIMKNMIKRDVVSFQYTYDTSTSPQNEIIKVAKIAKSKINNDVEYSANMTEHEWKIIEEFFEKKQNERGANGRGGDEKTDYQQFANRYNLDDLKSRRIKYSAMK